MTKLFKYLKKHVGWICVIIVLLVVQALSDLSMPTYISNIVNIGIQQGGYTSPVPDIIRASEMDKVRGFLSEDEEAEVLKQYALLSKDELSEQDYNSYVSAYPALADEPLYLLSIDGDKKEVADEKAALEEILSFPIGMVYTLDGDSETAIEMKQQMADQINAQKAQMQAQMQAQIAASGQTVPEGTVVSDEEVTADNIDIFEIFAQMPKEQLQAMTDQIKEQMADMPGTIMEQAGISFVKSEAQAIGINTDDVQTQYILAAGVKMLGLALLVMIVAVIVSMLASRIAATVGMELRRDVFHKVLSFSNAEFDKFSTASLITRSTNDIQQVQMLIVMLLRMVALAPIMAIGGLVKVFRTNVSMVWTLGLGIAVLLIVIGTLFSIVMPKFKSMQKLVDRVNLVTREILTGLPVIRAFSTEKHEMERFDEANKNLTRTNLFVNRAMSWLMPLMMLVMNFLTILIVWVGGHSIDAGTMQVGDMMAFIQYAMQIIMSFLILAMISIMLPRASVSAVRIDEVLTTKTEIIEKEHTQTMDTDKKGFVEFKDVAFSYEGAAENVIEGISFVAKPGETTAVIGSTGSGKSSLINLIPRFFDVTSGEILVDGKNVKDVSLHDLRGRIGYVPQKGMLFSGTIESNIKFSDENASDEVMEKAARIAQAAEFIESKTEGYHSDISQGGTNVSGGQKQRLSIARAIAKNPEIYIFDDSFSALDYKTDIALRKALSEETSESTVIIVAQRISTILHADQILVLDEGHLVGKGTHQELLKNCDVYYQIASSQLSEEELKHE